MTSIEQRSMQAGDHLRQLAEARADAMGDAEQIVTMARRRGRWQIVAATVGIGLLVTAVGSMLPRAGIVVDPATREVTAWTGASVQVPPGWQVASETLMPNGPQEQFVASTSDLPVGGDQCAMTPEAALEQLGSSDALVVVQRLHSAEPDDPMLGRVERWPEHARNQTALRDCPSNGNELDMYWFHAQLDGTGYWVLGAFGNQASEQRRAEALSILNSFQPAGVGTATEASSVVVPDVRGVALAQARTRLQQVGLEAAVASGADWQDPDGSDAVVVSQEPPADATVPSKAIVGLRTAEIFPPLCEVLTRVPARDGDAADLTRTDGFEAMLDDARTHAGPVLGEAIRQLLDDSGQPPGQAQTRAMDVVAIHHDGCHMMADTGQTLAQPEGWFWSQLPDGPVDGRYGAAVVWADDRMVVWGGEARQDVPADDGAVYDPATGTWTRTASSPLGPRAGHVAVWTGEQVIMCCGPGASSSARAAAYDPVDDTWQTLPDPPTDETVRTSAATMAGDLVIVLGKSTTSGDPTGTAVAYDTTTSTWRTLQAPPSPITPHASVAAAGQKIYVWMAPAGRAVAYDLETDTWSWLPEPAAFPQRADSVWTGTEWLVTGSDGDHLAAIAYAPTTQIWRDLSVPLPPAEPFEGNLGSQAAVWTERRLLLYTGALGSGLAEQDGTVVLAYDPADDTWQRLPNAPTNAYDPPLLWTDSQAIIYADPLHRLRPPGA